MSCHFDLQIQTRFIRNFYQSVTVSDFLFIYVNFEAQGTNIRERLWIAWENCSNFLFVYCVYRYDRRMVSNLLYYKYPINSSSRGSLYEIRQCFFLFMGHRWFFPCCCSSIITIDERDFYGHRQLEERLIPILRDIIRKKNFIEIYRSWWWNIRYLFAPISSIRKHNISKKKQNTCKISRFVL